MKQQPTSGWEEEFLHLFGGYPREKFIAFIRKVEAQAKEEGRREGDWHGERLEEAQRLARLATITLFEEWKEKKEQMLIGIKNEHSETPRDTAYRQGYNKALTDLLLFADSLKKKV